LTNVPSAGLSLVVPKGWHLLIGSPFAPGDPLSEPQPLAVAATFPVTRGSPRCSVYPQVMLDAVVGNAALVLVYERRSAPKYRDRTTRLSDAPSRANDLAGECHSAAINHRVIEFFDHNRNIQLLIETGTSITPRRQAELDRVLDSLTVSELAPFEARVSLPPGS
jgi:hypothetical protein